MKTIARRNRAGFTLTEMLVVIVIIVVLAGMLTPVVMTAMAQANKTKIKVELNSLALSLKRYMQDKGSYPPSSPADAATHVAKAYPLAVEAADAFDDTSKALVFWLGGLSPDPGKPFTGAGNKVSHFPFEQARVGLNGPLTYSPPISSLRQSYKYTRFGSTSGFKIESAGLDDVWDTDDDLKVEYQSL